MNVGVAGAQKPHGTSICLGAQAPRPAWHPREPGIIADTSLPVSVLCGPGTWPGLPLSPSAGSMGLQHRVSAVVGEAGVWGELRPCRLLCSKPSTSLRKSDSRGDVRKPPCASTSGTPRKTDCVLCAHIPWGWVWGAHPVPFLTPFFHTAQHPAAHSPAWL